MMNIMEWVPFALVMLALVASFAWLAVHDYRKARIIEKEIREREERKDPLDRGILWIP